MQDEAAKAVIEVVVNYLISRLTKEVDYVRKCMDNVKDLRIEVNNLQKLKAGVQQKMNAATSKGEILLADVQEWVEDNDRLIAKAEALLQEPFLTREVDDNQSCNCQNFGSLHQYGKKAAKISQSLVQQYKKGERIDQRSCSVPTSLPGFLELFDRKNYDDVNTQKQKLEEIIEAIKNEKIQIIEIHGTRGTGKTTLAKEAAIRVRNLFNDIVFIIVPQNIDSEYFRNNIDIAAKRIKNKEKILLILDDVSDQQLKMNNLGILYGKDYMNCKILLTSTLEEACSAKTMKKKISIYPLSPDEAWIVFKREAEIGENNLRVEELVAKEVAKACGGLPLILEVIGNTLKNKDQHMWQTTLDRLNDHDSHRIPEIHNAFYRLKLSYDYLRNDDVKCCFLLCSMFPEDASISLERLALYCAGLGNFDGISSIQEARNRVQIAVNTLKSSSLLMNGSSHFSAKMHDIVRNVAILIATENEGKNKFLVKAGIGMANWNPMDLVSLKTITGISLMQNSISKLHNDKLCVPLLEILLAQDNNIKSSKISDKFIKSLVKVKVLDMENNDISSLPSPMKELKELRMLNLGGNKSLQEIAILGHLEDLEILILNDTSIEQIPEEIGELKNLRLLQVRGCHALSCIAPGVISKLSSLEELNIGFYVEQVNDYNSLVELSDLSSTLTNLDLFVHAFSLIPEGVKFEKLKRFVIQIGGNETSFNIPQEFDSGHHHLILEIPDLPHSMAPKKLIEASDFIYLKSVRNVSNILPDILLKSFNEVKSVELIQCENVSCLVDTNNLSGLERNENRFLQMKRVILRDMKRFELLWKCPNQYIDFSKLEEILLGVCPKLARVFPVCVARGLVSLKSIVLSDCKSLEVVIWDGDHEETSNMATEISEHGAMKIVFPRLNTIKLDRLPKLNSFYSGNSPVEYPSLIMLAVSDCSSLKTWGSGLHKMKSNVQYLGEQHIIDDIMKRCSEKNEPVTTKSRVACKTH